MDFVAYIGARYPSQPAVVRVFSDERFPWRREENIEEMLTYVETNYKQELVDSIYSMLEEFENSVFEEEAADEESSDTESLGRLACSDCDCEDQEDHRFN